MLCLGKTCKRVRVGICRQAIVSSLTHGLQWLDKGRLCDQKMKEGKREKSKRGKLRRKGS